MVDAVAITAVIMVKVRSVSAWHPLATPRFECGPVAQLSGMAFRCGYIRRCEFES